jgi:polynucleotide 5'-hydroxyl-kinase GRC3/NOL9
LQQTVEPNKTLLVDGPASVCLVSGRAEAFAHNVKQNAKIVVREGKRLPLFVFEKAVFDIWLGPNASFEEAEGNTIPQSWNQPLEAILAAQKRPFTVMLVGKSDSGKSSLCTFLVNKLVAGKFKVAVLDGDLGQSDIGPSGTIAYAVTSKAVPEFFGLRLENAFFVGVTSPVSAVAKTIEGLTCMENEMLEKKPDFALINTDGWVEGELAVRFKAQLNEELKPDLIVCIQTKEELTPLIEKLKETPLLVVEPSSKLDVRAAEKRKSLREMTYTRYLKDAKVKNYPISQLTLDPVNPLPKNQEPQRGLLVGLYGRGSKFLGVGVLREINQTRRALKVQTAVSSKPHRLAVGRIILDEKLREVGEREN